MRKREKERQERQERQRKGRKKEERKRRGKIEVDIDSIEILLKVGAVERGENIT